MRRFGLMMALVGGLALGYQGFRFASTHAGDGRAERGTEIEYRVPPVVSGIVLVTGLLIVASGGRRDPD